MGSLMLRYLQIQKVISMSNLKNLLLWKHFFPLTENGSLLGFGLIDIFVLPHSPPSRFIFLHPFSLPFFSHLKKKKIKIT